MAGRVSKIDGVTLKELDAMAKEHSNMGKIAEALGVSRQRLCKYMRDQGFEAVKGVVEIRIAESRKKEMENVISIDEYTKKEEEVDLF